MLWSFSTSPPHKTKQTLCFVFALGDDIIRVQRECCRTRRVVYAANHSGLRGIDVLNARVISRLIRFIIISCSSMHAHVRWLVYYIFVIIHFCSLPDLYVTPCTLSHVSPSPLYIHVRQCIPWAPSIHDAMIHGPFVA